MRWGRGAFRLWVVGAVIWGGIAAAISYHDITAPVPAPVKPQAPATSSSADGEKAWYADLPVAPVDPYIASLSAKKEPPSLSMMRARTVHDLPLIVIPPLAGC